MDGPGDEVQEPLVEREAGPCPAPADTVQADQGGVAREPVERSNDYKRIKLKYECKKLINFRIRDKISVKGNITQLMRRVIKLLAVLNTI